MVRPEIKKKRRELAEAAIKSKKARKELEKISLRRRSKIDRSILLNQLKECQLQPNELQQMRSTSSMQTQGKKRFLTSVAGCNHEILDDPQTLVRRKRRKRNNLKRDDSLKDSSSSEDTDAVSTDTEIYYSETKSQEEPSLEFKVEPKEEIALVDKHAEKVESIAPLVKEPAIFVPVMRLPEVDETRMNLPIIGEEARIMETIRYNNIVIVSGETGSGKTTQIPQFLYEAGYSLNGKLIGVTEPRRVAAISMSERVSHELNLSSKEVSYQIRFAGNVTNNTKIKFMTDGVLLRECQQDFLLSKYSVIIIDEAHERSVFSDILIGLISRVVSLRIKRGDPLKLVIMSATLRVSDFTENSFLFRQPPPIINIEARQFPVTVHFARKTPSSYLKAAYNKVCSIHSKMPKGGILVFVTSQMDVKILRKKLSQKYPRVISTSMGTKPDKSTRTSNNKSKREKFSKQNCDTAKITCDIDSKHDLTLQNLKDDIDFPSEGEEDDDNNFENNFNFGKHQSENLDWSESDSEFEDSGTLTNSKSPLFCLGLYAMLPLEKQRLVFKDPPEGARLCVIATNVAETSITIPNIRYVVDTGMEKTKVYDVVTGVSRFITTWTSKSSAEQRSGRAGRLGPGHCYRLYSSAVFSNDLPDHSEPRILQKPVEDVILQMKSMNIDNVVNFPFPTRPSLDALKSAEKRLILLGALDDTKFQKARYQDRDKTEFSSRPTTLGKAMACFSLSARCSKMIVLSPPNLLPHVIALVSALTVREMFLEGNSWRDLKRKWSGHGDTKLLGDFMVMLRAVCVADSFQCSNKLCLEKGLRTKAMLEIDKLRKQLTHEINNNLNYPIVEKRNILSKPNTVQLKILRQLILSSYCDHVARRLPDGYITEKKSIDNDNPEKKRIKQAYECMEAEGPVFIEADSVLKGEHPDYIIYKELYQGDKKMFMRDVAVIEPEWLPHYASKLCSFNESTTSSTPPIYDKTLDQIMCKRSTTYGPLNWPLGLIDVPMHLVENGVDIFKYFASFLLAGEVFEWLNKYTSKLLSPPSIMIKPWSKLQPRTGKLLQALMSNNIKSKKDLTRIWKKDGTFLKREYLGWLPESLHQKFSQDWEQSVSCQ